LKLYSDSDNPEPTGIKQTAVMVLAFLDQIAVTYLNLQVISIILYYYD
jgi:hypothetical protein